MEAYTGKMTHVLASTMTKKDYYRQLEETPDNEDAEGYLIEWSGRKDVANKLWLPAKEFMRNFEPSTMDTNDKLEVYPLGVSDLTIGDAVLYLKHGYNVAREGWNGKNMYLFLVNGKVIDGVTHQEYVAMKTADGTIVPWLCSQSDLLASDFVVLVDTASSL